VETFSEFIFNARQELLL